MIHHAGINYIFVLVFVHLFKVSVHCNNLYLEQLRAVLLSLNGSSDFTLSLKEVIFFHMKQKVH